MKQKILDLFVTSLAILGIFMFIGAVGAVDMYVEMGEQYPVMNTIHSLVLGFFLVFPAIVRSVYGKK